MTIRAAEHDAERLLDSSWWTTSDRDVPLPVDPFTLASRLGVKVDFRPLPSDESGKIDLPAGGVAVITVNSSDHLNRQRFTCAHELGHYIHRRGHEDAGSQSYVDYRSTLAGLGIDSVEIYANQFAAALLMPAHLVERFYGEFRSPDALAGYFGTSAQAVDLRLRNLRLI